MQKYLPLLAVELYLICTILLYLYGPISFRTHNEGTFWLLIFLYHLAFIMGYLIASKIKFTLEFTSYSSYSKVYFYILLFLSGWSLLLTYKNVMFSNSIIPLNYFSDVIDGWMHPGRVYTDRMIILNSGQFESNRVLNIASLFIGFSKLFFIFYFLFFWSKLFFIEKFCSILYCVFFLSVGISAGLNSIIFQFVIFFSVSFVIINYIKKSQYLTVSLCFSFILIFIAVAVFGRMMAARGGGLNYFMNISSLGDISVSYLDYQIPVILDYYYHAYAWLDYYLVQGYYGFSLILDQEWIWTYGFGNSDFLQRQFEILTGNNISQNTFQYRVSEVWHHTAQWHSFYGQMSNDVGLLGVTCIMLLLGYYLCRVWITAVIYHSLYSIALLPILAILFIFIPANNQVFGYLDTLSYFLMVSLLRYVELRKKV